MGRGVDWAAQDVAQLRQWLEEGRKPREMRAMRRAHQHRMLHSDAGRRVLATCMARLGTDTSSWWWQEDNAPSHTSRRTKAFLKEGEIQLLTWPPCSPDLSRLDFHLWQEWETALGERQFQSQLELRAMIVPLKSLGLRARQRRPFRAPPVMDQLACTRFFWTLSDPS